MTVTQEFYNSTLAPNRKLYLKIELLNFNMQPIEQLEGMMISCSMDNDATSDIRRTASLSMAITDATYDIENTRQIWLDKYIKIYVGLDYNGNPIWQKQGVYMPNQPSLKYAADDFTLSFSCVDLMAKLTGARNGQMRGVAVEFHAGDSINDGMAGLCSLAGITNIVQQTAPYTIPNDITIEAGGTIYDAMTQLRDLIPNWQIYFDVDGVFCFNEIPSGQNEVSIINDQKFWNELILEYRVDSDFENVKNYIEVLGMSHGNVTYPNPPNTTATYDSEFGVFKLINSSVPAWDNIGDNALISFQTPSTFSISDNVPYYKLSVVGSSTSDGVLLNNDGSYGKILKPSTNYVVQKITHTYRDLGTLSIANTGVVTISLNEEDSFSDIQYVSMKFSSVVNYTPLVFSLWIGDKNVLQYITSFESSMSRTWQVGTTYHFVLLKNSVDFEDSFGGASCLDNPDGSSLNSTMSWELVGGLQAYGIAKDDNPNSPFFIGEELSTTVNSVTASGNYSVINTSAINNYDTLTSMYDLLIGIDLSGYVEVTTPQLKIGNLAAVNVVDSYGNAVILSGYCIVKYDGTNFVFITNNKGVGIIRKLCAGDDYDNIYTDQLANQRAQYELYKGTNLQNTANITMIPAYFLDSYDVVTWNPPNAGTTTDQQWLIKSISTDVSEKGTQSIELLKYYPENPPWVNSAEKSTFLAQCGLVVDTVNDIYFSGILSENGTLKVEGNENYTETLVGDEFQFYFSKTCVTDIELSSHLTQMQLTQMCKNMSRLINLKSGFKFNNGSMSQCFYNCQALHNLNDLVIGENITSLSECFYGCGSLSGQITILCNSTTLTDYTDCFKDCSTTNFSSGLYIRGSGSNRTLLESIVATKSTDSKIYIID